MTLTTTSGSVLHGSWRAGAYGGNRRAHLFVFHIGETRKRPACGARGGDKYTAVAKRDLADLCYDCLAYGVSGR